MSCRFRHVTEPTNNVVNFRLFRLRNGVARADVIGPKLHGPGEYQRGFSEIAVCMPLEDAYAAAIRLANKNDTELVVTGDVSLWEPGWGDLVH